MTTMDELPQDSDRLAISDPTLLKRAEACLQVRTARSPELLRALSKKSLSPEETQRTLHELMVQQIELEMQNDELRETQSALSESRDRFTQHYDSAPVGYMTLDAEGTVLEANLTLATMLNTARGRVVGLPINRFVAFNSQDVLYRHLRNILGSNKNEACNLELRRADRTTFAARMETIGFETAASGVWHYRCVISDFTERKHAEETLPTSMDLKARVSALAEQNSHIERSRQALEAKTTELEFASRCKSEFVVNMSHELRTPLNGLLLLSRLLAENREKNLTPAQLEHIQNIHRGGTDLLDLISEVLDLSKIESGRLSLDTADIPLAEVRDFVERSFCSTAEHKRLEFGVEIASGLPIAIHTDRQRLEQVLRNLLSNALKFSESGRVRLAIVRPNFDIRFAHPALLAAGGVLGFSVTDSGIGIPQEKQSLSWEAFQQADTGLSLTISREIARLLGGEIHLQSEPGRGTTFTLYLPEVYMPSAAPAARGSIPSFAKT